MAEGRGWGLHGTKRSRAMPMGELNYCTDKYRDGDLNAEHKLTVHEAVLGNVEGEICDIDIKKAIRKLATIAALLEKTHEGTFMIEECNGELQIICERLETDEEYERRIGGPIDYDFAQMRKAQEAGEEAKRAFVDKYSVREYHEKMCE